MLFLNISDSSQYIYSVDLNRIPWKFESNIEVLRDKNTQTTKHLE